jgi:hypothetical protein
MAQRKLDPDTPPGPPALVPARRTPPYFHEYRLFGVLSSGIVAALGTAACIASYFSGGVLLRISNLNFGEKGVYGWRAFER